MIDINNLWAKSRPQIPSVYDDSLSYLESIDRLRGGVVKIAEQTNENKENLNKKVSHEEMTNIYKLDQNSNFTGTWNGIPFSHTNEGLNSDFNESIKPFNTMTEKLKNIKLSIEEKATPEYVDNKFIQLSSATPKQGYATLEDLINAHPTNDGNTYYVKADKMIYRWENNTWISTNIEFLPNSLIDNSVIYDQIFSKSALSNINPYNLFYNPTLENNHVGWIISNNDGHVGVEIPLNDSFSKGLSVPITISGNSLIQRVPLNKLQSGDYLVRCKKKTTGNNYNGRMTIQVSNNIGGGLSTIYQSQPISSSIMEYQFTLNKESIISSYPTATFITFVFQHASPTANCIFYEPFLGSITNSTNYNNFKYVDLEQELNPLYSKILTGDGDSIMEGVSNGGGFLKLLSEKYGMITQNLGVGGGTIATGTYFNGGTPRHWICTNINNMRNDANYYVWEGGRNDWALDVPMGTITQNYNDNVNTDTFIGALEYLFRIALVKYKGKKKMFIVIHKANLEPYTKNKIGLTFNDYYNSIIEVCKKYSIKVCNLYENSGLITAFEELKNTYTQDNDGLHPNDLGYREYYIDIIASDLKTL